MSGGAGASDYGLATRLVERSGRARGGFVQPVLSGWLARPFGWVLVIASAVAADLVAWFRIPVSAHHGMDYKMMIWAPLRGLLSGYNVYNPAAVDYLLRYGVQRAESPHGPSMLLLLGWTAAFPERVGWLVFVALSGMALALCVLILLPFSPGRWAGLGVTLVVAAVVLGWPARTAYFLGQLTPVTALGAVVAFRWRGARAGALAVMLLAISPQTAVPMTVLLYAVGRRRGVLAGWVITALLSLPVLVVAAVNAGGAAALVHDVGQASGELVNMYRIDLPYLYGLRGAAAALAGFLAVAVVALLLHRYGRASEARWDRRSGLLFAVAAPVTVLSVYHQPYDITLIFLAAVALLGVGLRMPRSVGAASLLAGSATFLLFVLADAVFGAVLTMPAPAEIWVLVASPLVTVAGLLIAGVSVAVMARSSLAARPE